MNRRAHKTLFYQEKGRLRRMKPAAVCGGSAGFLAVVTKTRRAAVLRRFGVAPFPLPLTLTREGSLGRPSGLSWVLSSLAPQERGQTATARF